MGCSFRPHHVAVELLGLPCGNPPVWVSENSCDHLFCAAAGAATPTTTTTHWCECECEEGRKEPQPLGWCWWSRNGTAPKLSIGVENQNLISEGTR